MIGFFILETLIERRYDFIFLGDGAKNEFQSIQEIIDFSGTINYATYPITNFKNFKDKKGTVIIENSGNYNRAMPFKSKYRLMLQLTYTNFTEIHG